MNEETLSPRQRSERRAMFLCFALAIAAAAVVGVFGETGSYMSPEGPLTTIGGGVAGLLIASGVWIGCGEIRRTRSRAARLGGSAASGGLALVVAAGGVMLLLVAVWFTKMLFATLVGAV
ncbi:MAG: hypothetical protein JJU33_07590 [Phycisphaerales bacterium]|nr:hypothetical protein [Phycisphaerales bacterium]